MAVAVAVAVEGRDLRGRSGISCTRAHVDRVWLSVIVRSAQWNLQYVDYFSPMPDAKFPEDSFLHRSIMSLFGDMYDSFFADKALLKLTKDKVGRCGGTMLPAVGGG